MDEKIRKICKEIEDKYNIQIIFCVESGSRVWGMSSKDSDYDVRFVYKRNVEKYIQINQEDDVVKETYDKNFNECSAKGCYIDIVGFDIFKFIKLLMKSNPTCIEWIMSSKIYYGDVPFTFKEYIVDEFNPKAMFNHYKSMCQQNYLKYLKSQNLVTYKKYLYAMRGLVNAKWVYIKNTIPPIDFKITIEQADFLRKDIKDKLLKIIKLKKKGEEKDIIQNDIIIDDYIEYFLKKDDEPKSKSKEEQYIYLTIFNKELRRLVLNKK